MEDIAEHVDYVGDLVGRDHTCFASDYSHTYQDFLKAFIGVVDKYPPEKGFGAPTRMLAAVISGAWPECWKINMNGQSLIFEVSWVKT